MRIPRHESNTREAGNGNAVYNDRGGEERDGPSGFPVRAIARQAGATASAIYRHYPSLDALMRALSETVISELCAAAGSHRDWVAGLTGPPEQPMLRGEHP
jgi:AcrR family transcriptional regulator